MASFIVFNTKRNVYLDTFSLSANKAVKIAKEMNELFPEDEMWDYSQEHWAHKAMRNQKREDFFKTKYEYNEE